MVTLTDAPIWPEHAQHYWQLVVMKTNVQGMAPIHGGKAAPHILIASPTSERKEL